MSTNKTNLKTEIIKLWYRISDKSKYLEYKLSLQDKKYIEKYNNGFSENIKRISQCINDKSTLNLKHSGHIGDLIYALPALKKLSETKKINFYISINQSFGTKGYHKHPTGNIMITNKVSEMLIPLLKKQVYLTTVQKWNGEEIDIDLDIFRNLPFSIKFHSVRWYSHILNIPVDLNLPYLEVEPDYKITNKIIVVRTFRGRNPVIDYSFLSKYENILFLGTKSEFDDFVNIVPSSEFYDVKNFLELAQIMKSAKFVISNQTFAFAVAEGLKVPRILEANVFNPAVFPIGENCYDFYFQQQFEEQVKLLYNSI